MIRRFFLGICWLVLFTAGISTADEAWENKGYLDKSIELADYLGLNPAGAYEIFGVPEEVFPFRGDAEWQDNVVFYFSNHLYLFWFENRVWQVRLDERFEGEIAGIAMGASREEVTQRLGEPFYSDDTSIIYILPDIGVPVRLRLFFDEGEVNDLYVFRGDF